MKIDFQLTGGFTGLKRAVEINTDELPREKADYLLMMVERAKFFDIPESALQHIPDDEICSITIDTDERSRTLNITGSVAEIKLKRLIDYLTNRSRYTKHKKYE